MSKIILPEEIVEKIFDENKAIPEEELNKNKVLIIKGELALIALNDNVCIVIDKFRSGYECKTCNGTGKEILKCECQMFDRPGKNRVGGVCKYCDGNPPEPKEISCRPCNGTGVEKGGLIIQDAAKNTPTTGVIMSVGPDCTCPHAEIGKRVLFAPYTGTQIPFFKNKPEEITVVFMREREVLAMIEGVLDLSSSFNPDFVNAH